VNHRFSQSFSLLRVHKLEPEAGVTIQFFDNDPLNTADEPRCAETAPLPITARMRRGIIITSAGLVLLVGVAVCAVDAVMTRRGMPLTNWLWPLPLVAGVLLTGLGCGWMLEECARQSRDEDPAESFDEKDREASLDGNSFPDGHPPE
jgi:hypothetical protein